MMMKTSEKVKQFESFKRHPTLARRGGNDFLHSKCLEKCAQKDLSVKTRGDESIIGC